MLLDVDIQKQFSNFSCSFRFTLSCDRCGVFGPSGNGKSTLMHMIAGLLDPDGGRIQLDGKTLYDKVECTNLPPERRKIGVVFQHAHLFPHMNVKKNLFYGYKRTSPRKKSIEPGLVTEILKIDRLMERKVSKLSGGERQRVALGRAILAHPELILLDEPLSGLDSQLKFEIIPELKKVFDSLSIPMLFISHSLREMRMMTEETLILEKGRISNHLSTEDLAKTAMGSGGRGYSNILSLSAPEDMGNLLEYQWGKTKLMLLKTENYQAGEFTLGSRDILLFKKHPEAASARNMLACIVRKTYKTDWLWGVELDCAGKTLIAEVVPQSIEELNISPGSQVFAVFKASAFNKLW
jgi:molybdate transport system ATP-binding protein